MNWDWKRKITELIYKKLKCTFCTKNWTFFLTLIYKKILTFHQKYCILITVVKSVIFYSWNVHNFVALCMLLRTKINLIFSYKFSFVFFSFFSVEESLLAALLLCTKILNCSFFYWFYGGTTLNSAKIAYKILDKI